MVVRERTGQTPVSLLLKSRRLTIVRPCVICLNIVWALLGWRLERGVRH